MTERDFLFVPKASEAEADQSPIAQSGLPDQPVFPASEDTEIPSELVVMASPDVHKAIVFGAGAFCLLGIVMIVVYQEPFATFLALLAIGFFGPTAYFAWKRSRDNAPALVITDQGVFDNSSYCKVGLIPWDAIDDAVIHTVRGQQMLGINLIKGNTWEGTVSGLAKFAMTANRILGYEPVHIPRAAITKDLLPIQAVIRKRLGKPNEPLWP